MWNSGADGNGGKVEGGGGRRRFCVSEIDRNAQLIKAKCSACVSRCVRCVRCVEGRSLCPGPMADSALSIRMNLKIILFFFFFCFSCCCCCCCCCKYFLGAMF